MSTTQRRFVQVLVACGFFALGVYVGLIILERGRRPARMLWGQVAVGDTAESVIRRVGEPSRIIKRSDGNPHHYIDGYGYKKRPITGRVFIYFKTDLIFYVWLDADDQVEDTFVGTS